MLPAAHAARPPRRDHRHFRARERHAARLRLQRSDHPGLGARRRGLPLHRGAAATRGHGARRGRFTADSGALAPAFHVPTQPGGLRRHSKRPMPAVDALAAAAAAVGVSTAAAAAAAAAAGPHATAARRGGRGGRGHRGAARVAAARATRSARDSARRARRAYGTDRTRVAPRELPTAAKGQCGVGRARRQLQRVPCGVVGRRRAGCDLHVG